MTFQLHPQLDKDSYLVGCFPLCRLLLMNDSQFPWLVLVPEIIEVKEIYELAKEQRKLLIEESSYLSEQMAILFKPDKINIAAIGNVVPQLHVHHIARYRHDKAWPAPIWGKFPAIPYTNEEVAKVLQTLRSHLDFTAIKP